MVLVRRIHNRGANIVVEAHGEVLFAATGDVGRWTNRFSQRVRTFVAKEAPTNKRPRWDHYGKPLKTTMKSSTTYQPGRMKVYAAVGSTAPYSAYVDQGTGVYAGKSPYKAKILPPWLPVFDLYEHTWIPPGATRKVKPVFIKGQKGQEFFDKGLKRGFQSMRMRSFQVPGDAKITEALASAPASRLNILGNTPADAAFITSLTAWRAQRDARWNAERGIGPKAGTRKVSKPKKPTKPKTPSITKPHKGYASVADKKNAAVAQFQVQNPNIQIIRRVPSGIIVQTIKGPHLIPWSRLFHLID